jgi:hypothetical protein
VESGVSAAVKSASAKELDQTLPKGPLKTLCHALWHAVRIKEPEEAVIASAMSGDQASANAAATGALVGAMRGLGALPSTWSRALATCRPKIGGHVRFPRPRDYWPADIDSLAGALSWSAGARIVPVARHGSQENNQFDPVEQEMRQLFETLMERASSTGCRDSLRQLGEMAETEQAIEPAHKFMFADFSMGLRKRNWLPLALAHAEKVVSLAPDDEHAHFNIARIHWQMGDGDKARESLSEALRIMPDMGIAKTFLEYLHGHDAGA